MALTRDTTPRTLPEPKAALSVARRARNEAAALSAAYYDGHDKADERFALRLRQARTEAEAKRGLQRATLEASGADGSARLDAVLALDEEVQAARNLALQTATQEASREAAALAEHGERANRLYDAHDRLISLQRKRAGLAPWDRPVLDVLRLLGDLPPRTADDDDVLRAKEVEAVFLEELGVSRAQYYKRYHGLLTAYYLSPGLGQQTSRAGKRWLREEVEALVRYQKR